MHGVYERSFDSSISADTPARVATIAELVNSEVEAIENINQFFDLIRDGVIVLQQLAHFDQEQQQTILLYSDELFDGQSPQNNLYRLLLEKWSRREDQLSMRKEEKSSCQFI